MSLTKKILVTVGVLILIPLVAVATLLAVSGSADPPSRFFGGGALLKGEMHTGPEPDWRFVHELPTIEMQLVNPERSRITWVMEVGGKPYIVSGYMGSVAGSIWKHWPMQAERDGRAVIRVNGTRYERTLKRIKAGPEVEGVCSELRRKYKYEVTPADIAAGTTWLFELAPRVSATSGAAQ